MPLFISRNYAGVAAAWCADPDGPGRATAECRLQRLDLTVSWEYVLALIRTLLGEVSQNAHVPVWPSAIIAYVQERRRVLTCNERDVNYWGPHLDQDISYLTQSAKAPIARRVPDRPSLTTVHFEWVTLANLAVPLSYLRLETQLRIVQLMMT